jgi:signal transduction histidine kinase
MDAEGALRTSDPAMLAGVLDALGMPGGGAALLAPLAYRGTPLGVLAGIDRLSGDGRFSSADEQVLLTFAASTATAVAAARTVEADRLRRSIESAETERRRWARELHDETLQGLAALKVLLTGARRLEDPARMRAAIDGAIAHVARDIDGLHALITELRPAALDQLGLVPALESLGERTKHLHGLDVDLAVELEGGEDRRLDPEVETAAYRLVQEALTNVAKHARATAVRIRVGEDDSTLALEVADDGVGFDASAPPQGGFGVIGMRERAELVGGSLEFEPGHPGTVVRARLPLTPR